MLQSIERRLVSDWRWVATHAWSSIIIAAAALLSGAEAAVGFVYGAFPIAPAWFALLSSLLSAAAWLARLWAQREVTDADAA